MRRRITIAVVGLVAMIATPSALAPADAAPVAPKASGVCVNTPTGLGVCLGQLPQL
jgi:hypothetical protein